MRFAIVAAVLVLSLSACADSAPVAPLQPLVDRLVVVSARADAACVGPATVTVKDEELLHAAVAKARAGDVIAISGTIALTRGTEIYTADVTITCARPGDGLTARKPIKLEFELLNVYAPRVTIQGLIIDATGTGGAVVAYRFPDRSLAARATRVIGNDIRCGSVCLFFVGVDHAEISDNHFLAESPTVGSGIHLQRAITKQGDLMIDGTRIERNTLVATVKTGASAFGALRPRDGRDVVVRDNVVIGPWSNSMATANLHGSVIQGNRFEGALQYALFLGANPQVFDIRGVLVRRNELASAGKHALFVDRACGNVFVANRISAPAGATDVLLTKATGDNMLLGQPTESIDNGAMDCDGDGAADPNFLTGGGRNGAEPGDVIGPVMSNASGVIRQ